MKLAAQFTIRPPLLLAALVALLALVSIRADFLFIDDISLIVNNPQMAISPRNLGEIFSQPLAKIYAA